MGPKGRRQGERPAAARFEVVRHGLTAHLESPTNFCTYPYVAPHTTNIHTSITLGMRCRTKPLVF